MERGHQVAETFVERGYDPEEEVKKPVNWFSAPWIYKKYVDKVFNVGLTTEVLLAGDGRIWIEHSRSSSPQSPWLFG